MAPGIQVRMGHVGYRRQLDRARRFLDRINRRGVSDVDFQDMIWAFFQNCWHIKDWLRNDPLASEAQKTAAIAAAHASPILMACRDLCNGTKHLGEGYSLQHSHVDIDITPGDETVMDCIFEDASGNQFSGRLLAVQSIAEWENILRSQNLATERLS
jgi:hypothetical protein